VRVGKIQDAFSICKRLNGKELKENFYLKAHLHPDSNYRRFDQDTDGQIPFALTPYQMEKVAKARKEKLKTKPVIQSKEKIVSKPQDISPPEIKSLLNKQAYTKPNPEQLFDPNILKLRKSKIHIPAEK